MSVGRKKTPTKILKLKGNPGKRPLPVNEPKPKIPAQIPNAPKSLDRVARKEWKRISKELHSLGLLTNIDTRALEGYCASYSLWIDCQEKIKKHGILVKSQSGFPMQSPLLSISNRAMVEMRKWLVEFGMTPSSRARVTTAAPQRTKEDDDDGM